MIESRCLLAEAAVDLLLDTRFNSTKQVNHRTSRTMLRIGRDGPRVCVISNEDITEVGNDWQIMLSHTLSKDQGFGAGQIWHYPGPLYNY